MNPEVPSKRYTFGLLCVFFIPYFIAKNVSEPYPAVILPSGASTTKVSDDRVYSKQYFFYGINREGKATRIDLVDDLKPISAHYIKSIVDNELGLVANRTTYLVPRKKRGKYFVKASTEANVERARQWYYDMYGGKFIALRVLQKKVLLSKASGEVLKEETLRKAEYELIQ